MNKKSVLSTMLSLEEALLEHAKHDYADYLMSARIDRSEPVQSGDASQAEMASELAEAFDQPIHAHFDKIDKLKSLDFSTKTDVEEGAVVKLNNRYFVISISSAVFECEGESFMGISTDAPIYQPMEGLQTGDTFTFHQQKFEIQAVY